MYALLPRLVMALTFGQTDPAAAPPPPPPPADPAAELRECDGLLGQRKVALARACFEALRLKHPGTSQAHDAERAISIIDGMGGPAAPPPAGPAPAGAGTPAEKRPGFYVAEPYSPRTRERLRLTTWEKLDFGTTAFIYGLLAGAAFGGATDSDVLPPMVAGSLLYTGLGVLYVNTAQVDRGDLPLALGITSYLPSTAGLIALASETDSPKAAATMVTGAGLAALPLAYWAAASTDLDPGDTQLVRDAGFWGMIWGVTGALATNDPSRRSVGIAGLAGLYGGLGLGLLAASASDVSLERVRVTTWGGYGGAVLGVLLAAGSRTDEEGAFASVAIGSALGVLVTFLSTGSIDDVPAEAQFDGNKQTSLRYLEPALLTVVERDGRVQPRPGLNLLRGRF